MCCGLSSLAAGLAIGIAGDAGVRANAQKDIYVGVILILIFAEALGLYGLIISIILSGLGTPMIWKSKLIDDKLQIKKIPIVAKSAYMIKAWNHFRSGVEVSILKYNSDNENIKAK